MTKNKSKLEAWALRELEHLMNSAIIQLDSQNLLAFGCYRITRAKNRYRVTVGSTVREFGSSRSAMSWCVLDKAGRPDWCIHLENLDERSTRLSEDLAAREHVFSRSGSTKFRDNIADKLAEKRHALHGISRQLDKYANKAKYLQHQGFANETARTRRA